MGDRYAELPSIGSGLSIGSGRTRGSAPTSDPAGADLRIGVHVGADPIAAGVGADPRVEFHGGADLRVEPEAAEELATRLESLRNAGALPATLREIGVPREDLAALAASAATQWTGTCNPRPFDPAAAQALYERAL